MPHDLSRSNANSASSSALSYAFGAPPTTNNSTGTKSTDVVDHSHHHFHKTTMDDDDDDDDDDDESTQQKKLKRTKETSPIVAAHQPKLSIVNADMIFYCFEILGNHLFNGRHRHQHTTTSSSLVPVLPSSLPREPYPLFVSWFIGKDKQLRGCIGTFSPMDLAEGLREYALTSALNDSRFSPISRDEYPLLHCAVSILTHFEPCSSFNDWEVGLHGIRIEFLNERGARRSATYLPEVAHEQGWNHTQTLDSLLRKGGYRATITADMRKSVQVTRYRSEKLSLHYNDFIQARPSSIAQKK